MTYTLVPAAPGVRNFKPICISSDGYKFTELRHNKNGSTIYRCSNRKCDATITLKRDGDWQAKGVIRHSHASKPGLLKGKT